MCPVCTVELRLADRQGIEIDYCPQCRGIWLDRGELEKLIDRSTASFEDQGYGGRSRHGQEEHEDRKHRDRYREEHGDKHGNRYRGERRRGSFLGDLFDF